MINNTVFNNTGSESSYDLASVNKIIESTATENIQMFLKPQATTSGSDDSEPHTTPWESADEDSDQSLDQLYKQSLSGKIIVKKEPEVNDKDAQNGDNAMEVSAEEESCTAEKEPSVIVVVSWQRKPPVNAQCTVNIHCPAVIAVVSLQHKLPVNVQYLVNIHCSFVTAMVSWHCKPPVNAQYMVRSTAQL